MQAVAVHIYWQQSYRILFVVTLYNIQYCIIELFSKQVHIFGWQLKYMIVVE
jgi:hypothetical protein